MIFSLLNQIIYHFFCSAQFGTKMLWNFPPTKVPHRKSERQNPKVLQAANVGEDYPISLVNMDFLLSLFSC